MTSWRNQQPENLNELQEPLNQSATPIYNLYNINYQDRDMSNEFVNDDNPSSTIWSEHRNFQSSNVKSSMSKQGQFNNYFADIPVLIIILFMIIVNFYYSMKYSDSNDSIPYNLAVFVSIFIALLLSSAFVVGLFMATDILLKVGIFIVFGLYIVTNIIALALKSYFALLFLIIIIPNGLLLYVMLKKGIKSELVNHLMPFFKSQFYVVFPSLLILTLFSWCCGYSVCKAVHHKSTWFLVFLLVLSYVWIAKIFSNCVYMCSSYFSAISYFIASTDDKPDNYIIKGLYRTHIQNFGVAVLSSLYPLLTPFRALAEMPPNRPEWISKMKFISEKVYHNYIYGYLHKFGSKIMLFFDKILIYPSECGMIYTGIFGIPFEDSKMRIAEINCKTYVHQIKGLFILVDFFKFFRIPLSSSCACLIYAILKEYNKDIQNTAFALGFFITYAVFTLVLGQLKSMIETFIYCFIEYPDAVGGDLSTKIYGEYSSSVHSLLLPKVLSEEDERANPILYE